MPIQVRRAPAFKIMFVLFRLIGELDFDLTKIGLGPGKELTGQLDPVNKAINFNHFYVIENNCVVWEDNYEIISTDFSKEKDYVSQFSVPPIHAIENLFDIDDDQQILVIKVSDLSNSQKFFLGI